MQVDNKLRELLAARNAKWDAEGDAGRLTSMADAEQVALHVAAAEHARHVTGAEWVALPDLNCIETARKGSTPHLTVCATFCGDGWSVMAGGMSGEGPDLLDALRSVERQLAEALASVRALGVGT